MELTYPRWKPDVQALVRALRPYLDAPGPGREAGGPHEAAPANQPAEPTQDRVSGAPTFEATTRIDAKDAERVSRKLATYIGPISELVVKRAAKRSTSLEELCGIVAREIDSEPDRQKFLKSCRG